MAQPNKPPVLTDSEGVPIEFDLSFDFQGHDWVQTNENYKAEIICSGKSCNVGHRHGHSIPTDKVLVGSRGSFRLVHYDEERELRRRKPKEGAVPEKLKPTW